MKNSKVTQSHWNPEKKLITTHISGELEKTDIERWEASLKDALNKITDNSTFKIFVNLNGFKAIDMDAHKRFRSVIPLTLADYGWKVGYVNLFEEEAKTLQLKNTRGISCVAAAHTHQDESKMHVYETKFSSSKEHFFPDPQKAIKWLEELDVSN